MGRLKEQFFFVKIAYQFVQMDAYSIVRINSYTEKKTKMKNAWYWTISTADKYIVNHVNTHLLETLQVCPLCHCRSSTFHQQFHG